MSTGDIPEFGEGGFPTPNQPFPEDVISEGEFSLTPNLEEGRCCHERATNIIAAAVASIANSVNVIVATTEKKVEEPCKDIDKCIDKIIDALRKKIEGPVYSCEQCKSMIANGLGGTLEYAVRCAAAECDKCLEVCSGQDDGKCCKNCGQDKINCRCEAGHCVGDDKPEEKKKAKFIGWCNPLTGQIAVTKQGEPGMPPPWKQVALTETEQAAVEIATNNCEKFEVTITPSPEQVPPSPPFPTYNCDLNLYATQGGIESFSAGLNAALQVGGWAQVADNLGDLGIGGLSLENFGQIITGVVKSLYQIPMKFSVEIADGLSKLLNCNHSQFSPIVQTLMNIGLAQKFVGVDLSEFAVGYKYAMNAICRQKFLGPDGATAAYLANAIDYKQLDTQWAINGYCPQAVQWNLQASKAKPVPLQLAVMRHRELITPEQYHAGMRQLGFIEPLVAEQQFAITYQVPTMSDIIRFMVRDADDESIVQRFGLDDNFADKYRSQLKKWSKDQGIDETIAKYSWRSHWQIPSPTQLFEFNRRLRHNEKFGGVDKLQEDIKAALIQQDILPYWHEHYLAVSYLPMTRMDLRRAFAVGAIDEKQVESGMQQIGHNDETAKILTQYVIRLRDRSIAATQPVKLWKKYAIDRAEVEKRLADDKVPADVIKKALDDIEQDFDKSVYAQAFAKGDINRQSLIDNLAKIGVSNQGASKIADRVALRVRRHPALNGYAAGGVDRAKALAEMTSFGMNIDVTQNLLDDVDQQIKWQFLQRCQAGVKRRYLDGEIDGGEASNILKGHGTTQERVALLINEWQCEKSAIGKSIPTATLCQLLEQGAITVADFTKRLENIGYTDEDALLLTNNCLSAIEDRRQKAIQAEIKANQQRQRQQAQALQRAAAAAQRAINQENAERNKAANTRKRREKQVIDAAEKLYKKCNCDIYTAIGVARSVRQQLTEAYDLDVDTILAILIKAADNMTTGDLSDYATHADTLAQEVIDAQPELLQNALGAIESSNGQSLP